MTLGVLWRGESSLLVLWAWRRRGVEVVSRGL